MNDVFPQVGDGFLAEVSDGKYHLTLFSETYELGYRAMVYDVNTRTEVWRGDASDYEDGKKKAEQMASEYVKLQYNTKLSAISWNMNPQLKSKQKRG